MRLQVHFPPLFHHSTAETSWSAIEKSSDLNPSKRILINYEAFLEGSVAGAPQKVNVRFKLTFSIENYLECILAQCSIMNPKDFHVSSTNNDTGVSSSSRLG